MIEEIKNPDLYHGENKKNNFFEGWYFKVADKSNDNVFAFIPGILKSNDKLISHNFIQVLSGKDKKFNYIRYSQEDFQCEKGRFLIGIKNNLFSLNKIRLSIQTNEVTIEGSLDFNFIKKWPDTTLNPGSMGFYNYLQFMECYSQVCALDGFIDGKLNVNGKEIDFTGGKVYIEKNWGKSFPKSWIWVQSNSFENKNVSLTCSIGRVPFLFGSFSGFLAGLLVENNFYSFTSVNSSKMKIFENNKDVEIQFYKKSLKLTIKTESNINDFILCLGPKGNNMVPFVKEALTGLVYVELLDTKLDKCLFRGKGFATGIEYGGDMITKK